VNFVFNVSHPTECVYYPVGGENRSKAIINYLYEIEENTSEFIEYRARKAKDYNGKPITTDNTGLLSTSELIPKGYRTWWACEKCESEDCFEYVIIDGYIDGYKCKKCGHTAWIPYAD
jgi:hypothetical protein